MTEPRVSARRAFVHELRELGWVDGQTVTIAHRSLGGDPQRASGVLVELLAGGVHVTALGGMAA